MSEERTAEAEVSQALSVVVADYGTQVLGNPDTLGNLLRDHLPDHPREINVLQAASQSGAAAALEERIGSGMAPAAAVRMTAAELSSSLAIDSTAAEWGVGEFARALGHSVRRRAAAPRRANATQSAAAPSDAQLGTELNTGSGFTAVPQDDDVLRAEHLSKRFGAVTALVDINLHLRKGEVLGLLGDNGAGKSTMLKIFCGFQRPDSGRLIINGEEVQLRSVDHARALGVDAVYQDLALINQLSVYHNMFLKREQVHWPLLANRTMRRAARQYLDEMGVNIPSVDAQVASLSGGQRQAIAIARTVYSDAKILLLDEPLAAMGAKEATIIMDVVRDLKRKGDVSMIIIAHNYGQVLEICDRVNLLQHGEITLDKPSNETSVQELNDIVVEEYRRAREQRQRQAG